MGANKWIRHICKKIMLESLLFAPLAVLVLLAVGV